MLNRTGIAPRSAPVHFGPHLIEFLEKDMQVMRVLALVLFSGTASAQPFPAGMMRDVVTQACTQCHAADVVTSQVKTRDEWAGTVSQMIANGANVSEGDYDKVVDYLAANFPSAMTRKAPTPQTVVARTPTKASPKISSKKPKAPSSKPRKQIVGRK